MVNLGNVLQVKNLLPVASVTSDGNGSGVDIQSLEGQIAIVLDCSAPVAGSSPTMDVKIQDSSDNSTFADVSGAAFTQVTSSASVQKMVLNSDSLARYIRVVKDIGGTSSPEYLMSVKAYGIEKVLA